MGAGIIRQRWIAKLVQFMSLIKLVQFLSLIKLVQFLSLIKLVQFMSLIKLVQFLSLFIGTLSISSNSSYRSGQLHVYGDTTARVLLLNELYKT